MKLVNDRLDDHLAPYVYTPVNHTPSLCDHKSNGIILALVVDNFGIKAISHAAFDNLLQALR